MMMTFFIMALGVALGALFTWWLGAGPKNARLRGAGLGLLCAAMIYVFFLSLQPSPWQLYLIEIIGMIIFGIFAHLGAKRRLPRFLAIGWILHVVWDIGLHDGSTAPYVPEWYPSLCIGFDLVVAAWLLTKRSEEGSAALTDDG